MEAVELVLDKISQLHQYHADLIKDWNNMKCLVNNLQVVKAFLGESSVKSNRKLVLQIRDFVHEVDDIIDAYVANAADNSSKRYFGRVVLDKPVVDLDAVNQRFRSLLGQLKSYIDASSSSDLQLRKQEPPVRDNMMVGMEDVTAKVISYLREESDELDVITIVGMPGIGKTAVAWKTYVDPDVMSEFPIRIWIDRSIDFTVKEFFLAILKHFPSFSDEYNGKKVVELANLIAANLEKGNFLIVVDDVVSADDWDKLQYALPKSTKKGKVLITSCDENVAWKANKYRRPYLRVRFLTQSEGWSLLKLKIFGNLECPSELEDIGELIVEQCEGLPLAILTVARILQIGNLSSSTMPGYIKVWNKVCSRVPEYTSNMFHISLPYHLQPCFLYFGMFPSDFEIPVRTLVCLWIAEGFVQEGKRATLEDTAEMYLEELVNRNLVMVDKRKSDGRIKSCRIHPILHNYCRTEAGKEGILQQLEFSDGDLSRCYRLCITSNILDFLSSKPFAPRVRSFVGFSHDEVSLPPEISAVIPHAFKLLRVLDVPIKFTKIPIDMYRLIHMRFLTLSLDSAILPSAFSKLWNIQTLTVNTTHHTLTIKPDICQFTQLRHFKTNACAALAKPQKHSKQGETLQTLAMVSPASCTKEFFAKACNLKKLGIRGKLSLFLDGENGSFDCLSEMTRLGNLKLVNDVDHPPPSEDQLRSLPPANKFPPSLRSLTLARTYLNWDQMPILELLKSLKVLKLKDNAFVGEHWRVTDDGGFRNLEALHIAETDLVRWEASAHYFPRLRSLKLRHCEKLEEVPIELADIPTLQLLDLFETNLAADSAKRIKERMDEELSMDEEGFKLTIYPPS